MEYGRCGLDVWHCRGFREGYGFVITHELHDPYSNSNSNYLK